MKEGVVSLVYWSLFSNDKHRIECIPFSDEKDAREYFDKEWNDMYDISIRAINSPNAKDGVKNAPVIKLSDLLHDKNGDIKKYKEQKDKPHFLIDDIADNYRQLEFIDCGKTTISYIICRANKAF